MATGSRMTIWTRDEAIARYLKVEAWARNRYSYDNERGQPCWLHARGLCTPGRVTRIEDMAAVRYLGCTERYSGRALADCPTR